MVESSLLALAELDLRAILFHHGLRKRVRVPPRLLYRVERNHVRVGFLGHHFGHDIFVVTLAWLVNQSFLSGTFTEDSFDKGRSEIGPSLGFTLGYRLLDLHIEASEHGEGGLPLTGCKTSFSLLCALGELSQNFLETLKVWLR